MSKHFYVSPSLFLQSRNTTSIPLSHTEEALDVLGILRTLEWKSPVIMTSNKNLGKILAVKSFSEQHQVAIHSVSFPKIYVHSIQLTAWNHQLILLKKDVFCLLCQLQASNLPQNFELCLNIWIEIGSFSFIGKQHLNVMFFMLFFNDLCLKRQFDYLRFVSHALP